MGIHELELIDLEEEEERAYQRQNRRASRPARRKELEEWPMDDWQEESPGITRRMVRQEERARVAGRSMRQEEESVRPARRSMYQEERKPGRRRAAWQDEVADDWLAEAEAADDWLEEEDWPEEEDWLEEEDWQEEAIPKPRRRRKTEKPTPKYSKADEIKRKKKKRKRRARIIRGVTTLLSLFTATAFFVMIAWLAVYFYTEWKGKNETAPVASTVDVQEVVPNQDIREWADFYALELERPELAVDLLTINEYSRPGETLPEVNSIFIHYTANAGTTAEQNRSYFESLAESHERSASAHFVIGIYGTIVQCIPTKEIAYAVKGRNYDSISIECCYMQENGKFETATYDSLIELTAWLLHKYELEPEDVLRHYDEGGKHCPNFYVENEEAWDRFLADLEIYMRNLS